MKRIQTHFSLYEIALKTFEISYKKENFTIFICHTYKFSKFNSFKFHFLSKKKYYVILELFIRKQYIFRQLADFIA